MDNEDSNADLLTKTALYFCREFIITKNDIKAFKDKNKALKKQYKHFLCGNDSLRTEAVYEVYRFGDDYVDAKKFDQFFMLLDPDIRNKVYLNLNSAEITDGCFYYTEFPIEEVDDLYSD